MTPAAPDSVALDLRIGFWGRFEAPRLEDAFRLNRRPQEVRQASMAMVAAMLVVLVFIPNDYSVLSLSPRFWLLFCCRVAVSMIAAAMLVFFRRGVRPIVMDRTLFAGALIAIALRIAVAVTRSGDALLGYMFTEFLVLLLIYFVLPFPLPFQAMTALLSSTSDVALLLAGQGINPVLRRSVIVSMLLTNLIGLVWSWNLQRLTREQFLATSRETSLRTGLESALAEVKTLRGIVPICAHCKAVRNDEGFWQQVEVYVREHSHAEFTHGICPACLKALLEQEHGRSASG